MIKEHFQGQIDFYPQLTDDILAKADFKTVWSGKRLVAGDRLLHAYVYQVGTDNLKAITFVERELNELDARFNFLRMENEIVPVLSFKEDTKSRN